MAGGKATPAKIAARDHEEQAMDLRRRGYSYDRIAKELGISRSGAHEIVTRVLKRTIAETKHDAVEIIELEVERLDTMLAGLWPAAERGDPEAVSTSLRLMERRAKLLGLDAASRSEVTGANGAPLDGRAALAVALAKLTQIARPDDAGGDGRKPGPEGSGGAGT